MRIVHVVVGKVNPETLNGVSRALHGMATSQSRLGHDVEVWGLTTSTTPSTHAREYKLRIYPMTRLRVTLAAELKAALDIIVPGTWVHFHSVFVPEYPAMAKLLRSRGFKYGVTPHGGYAAGVIKLSPWKKRLYIALREAGYLRHAAWIQAVGESEIQDARRIDPRARVIHIPHGQQLLSASPDAARPEAERPLIGFCGRLTMWVKGLDFLFDGFAAYKAKGGKGELWLIGDGEDRASLERRAEQSGVKSHVSFFGTKFGQEKLDLVASVDAFIHTSRWDVLPTACLEAAALGRPLVVSQATNLAKFVERSGAGLVLDELSAAGVLRALERVQRLYEDGQLQAMGDNARSLVENQLTWERNASSFIAAIATSGVAV